jgi:hypothetical protein
MAHRLQASTRWGQRSRRGLAAVAEGMTAGLFRLRQATGLVSIPRGSYCAGLAASAPPARFTRKSLT